MPSTRSKRASPRGSPPFTERPARRAVAAKQAPASSNAKAAGAPSRPKASGQKRKASPPQKPKDITIVAPNKRHSPPPAPLAAAGGAAPAFLSLSGKLSPPGTDPEELEKQKAMLTTKMEVLRPPKAS